LLAVYVFLFHLSVMMLPFFVLMGDISAYMLCLGLLIAKAVVEFLFLRQVSSWLTGSMALVILLSAPASVFEFML
jgi:hypothetical protein